MRLGDVVEIPGRDQARRVRAERARDGGAPGGPGPVASSAGAALLRAPDGTVQTAAHVSLVGTVQRAWDSRTWPVPSFAEVAVEGGIVRASFWDYTPADVTKLVGAKVRLTGNAGTLNDAAAQLRGVSMLINRGSDVVILEAAESPFSLPLQPLESLYRHLSAREPFRRSRVSGVVTAYVPGAAVDRARQRQWTHLLGDRARALHSGRHGRRARGNRQAGCRVTPATASMSPGFPYVTGGKPVLKYADVRVVGSGPEPQPVELPLPLVLTPDRDASLVSLFVPDSWVSSRAAPAGPWSSRPAMAPSTPRCTALLTHAVLAGIRPGRPRRGHRRLRVPGWLAAVVSFVPPLIPRCRRAAGGAVVDTGTHGGARSALVDRRRGRGSVDVGERAAAAPALPDASSTSAPAWPASCTTPSSKGWPGSSSSSRRWPAASRTRQRPPSVRCASRGRWLRYSMEEARRSVP